MFTGLISDVGEVVEVRPTAAGARISIACGYRADSLAIGASVACGGPCLTVTEVSEAQGRTVFAVDVSAETLRRTTLGGWRSGTRVNLERSLRLGDELGGHMVTGHVDDTAEITEREAEGETVRFTFRAPEALASYIAEKGSVALDGTSLTVNGVLDEVFWVTLIPHSLAVTTWQNRKAGDRVNIEIDLLARYVARLAHMDGT